MSSCYHFVSTIPPLSSGQDTLNLMGDTERIILMSLQPRDVQTPIFPLICVVTSVEHLSGAMTRLFFPPKKYGNHYATSITRYLYVLIIVSDLKCVLSVKINEL